VSLLLLLPTSMRDVLYGVIARLRYRVFGRVDVCRMPTSAERARFLSY
jgi:predicted DCC family thiol-disulfide oxidoreductase YuxK